MLREDVIEFSNFLWVVFIVFVKKWDGMICFCVDYWKLNFVIKKDVYLLLWIDEFFDILLGVKYFCILDFVSGYW